MQSNQLSKPVLFDSGRVVITAAAKQTINSSDIIPAFLRHMGGDWGDVYPSDGKANDYAVNHRRRIISSYKDRNKTAFWIITEADRSCTTILLPDDY